MNDSPMPRPKLLLVVSLAAIMALYLLYLASNIDLFIEKRMAPAPPVMTATQEMPQSDFARFWFVGKSVTLKRAAAFGHQLAAPADFAATFQLNILSAKTHPKSIWLYPPTMTLLAIPFAMLPLALSFWVWQFVTCAVAALLLRAAGLSWLVIASGLLSPAAIHSFYGGQNGALTGGLLVASLLLFDQKPRIAGAVAGVLCIKPQMALVFPFILMRLSRRPALISFGLVVLGMVILSAIAVGFDAWVWFFRVAQPISSEVIATSFREFFPAAGITVFMMARSLHAGVAIAWAAQGFSSLVSFWLVWRLWKKPSTDPLGRMAVTMCLSVLMTPYGFLYDLVGYSVAMAAMFWRAPDRQKPLYGIFWLSAGYTGSAANITGLILMPLVAIVSAWFTWREVGSMSLDG
jgi:alpha-1,2-mannosyltransferase